MSKLILCSVCSNKQTDKQTTRGLPIYMRKTSQGGLGSKHCVLSKCKLDLNGQWDLKESKKSLEKLDMYHQNPYLSLKSGNYMKVSDLLLHPRNNGKSSKMINPPALLSVNSRFYMIVFLFYSPFTTFINNNKKQV